MTDAHCTRCQRARQLADLAYIDDAPYCHDSWHLPDCYEIALAEQVLAMSEAEYRKAMS